MKEVDELKVLVDQLTESNTALTAEVEEGNTKTDGLITAVGTVLVRLQELKDAANQGGNVTAADIQPLIDKVQGVLTNQAATTASLNAQDAETDASALAAAAALVDEPPVDPPPSDDAFVAVGGTRFSDGLVQTEETLAAAVIVWNDAHPEGPVAG